MDSLLSGLLLRDAELDGSRRADIRVRAGLVARIAPALDRLPGEEVLDCGGAAVIPGLCDHHLHLHAMAAARSSVRCGPPSVRTAAQLAAALRAATPDENGWIRGTGYVAPVPGDLDGTALDGTALDGTALDGTALDATALDGTALDATALDGTALDATALDATALDAMRPDVPVRIQHRSGALWVLNSAALAATGAAGAGHPGIERDAAGAPTGRLWRADDWLRDRLGSTGPPSLAAIGAELLGYGVTAVTDATPDLDAVAISSISDAMARGELPPRVHLLGVPLGASVPPTPGLQRRAVQDRARGLGDAHLPGAGGPDLGGARRGPGGGRALRDAGGPGAAPGGIARCRPETR